CQHGYGVPFSF
nr:immunoglobulin light chain junction region [Macaca mulatta]